MFPKILRLLNTSIALLSFILSPQLPAAPETSPTPTNTILWISLDGFSSKYLETANTPFLNKLKSNSAWSDQLSPVFPSITFTSHASIATGTHPEQHGITGNSFYDSETSELHRYPNDANLIQTEPIWITAERQGIRTAVFDWPLAHAQSGEITASYFDDWFHRGLTDRERLTRLLDTWENDADEKPLQLLMGYTTSPDREGHQHSPNSPKTIAAIEQLDSLLAEITERARKIWENKKNSPDDRLFIILTSDHGMMTVNTAIHPEKLLGLNSAPDTEPPFQLITTGNIAHLFFSTDLDEDQRAKYTDAIFKQLRDHDFISLFRRHEIPPEWHLRHPTRTGDLFLVLAPGHTFDRRIRDTTLSLTEIGREFGMHGFHPQEVPEMKIPLFIHRHPEPFTENHLGEIDSLQLHPTIASLLGIEPSPHAKKSPLHLQPAPNPPHSGHSQKPPLPELLSP